MLQVMLLAGGAVLVELVTTTLQLVLPMAAIAGCAVTTIGPAARVAGVLSMLSADGHGDSILAGRCSLEAGALVGLHHKFFSVSYRNGKIRRIDLGYGERCTLEADKRSQAKIVVPLTAGTFLQCFGADTAADTDVDPFSRQNL